MTSDTSPPSDPTTWAEPASTPSKIADVLAALPAMLGFPPRESLVLLSTTRNGQRGVDLVLRVDLPPPRAVAAAAAELAEALRAQRCQELLLVVIGGGAADPPDRPPRSDLVAEVTRACAAAGVDARGAVWAAELAAGAPWRCYGECGCAGRLPDPACSPWSAEAVLAGRVIYADRAELERAVAPRDPRALRRRAALLGRRIGELARAGRRPADDPQLVAAVGDWVDRVAARPPDLTGEDADEDVVRLCLALSDELVRDAAFGFACLPATAAGAERLWSVLVTEAPDPAAAEPAVLLAHSALLAENWALAGVALDRARGSCPGHSLGALYRAALDAGYGPSHLREWIARGSRDALAELAGRGGWR